jgi:large subunit ribosomal protein L1
MTSKRFKEISKAIDPKKSYALADAVALLKAGATAKFDETVELHLRLGIDPRQSDQLIRSTVSLPHGTGKTKRVVAFVESAQEATAKEAGADIVGGEELIDELVKTGKIDFDVAVATPAMMPKLAKAARVLGPKGLMPNPKTDTVSPNVAKMITEQKGGKVTFKNDNTANLHMVVGKASFKPEQLVDNVRAAIEALRKVKPASSKGIFMRSITIKSTMGPGISLDGYSI